MKRRDFIRNVAPVAVIPFISNKITAAAYDELPMFVQTAMNMAPTNDKILVLVQLSGGNDGLNTVIPLDQYTNLSIVRGNVLIPQNQVLQLGNTQTGLHPAMTGLKTLFDMNKLTVIQNVGYASPNFSHFRASDIWHSGSTSSQVLDSGWLGRFLEYEYPGAPIGYPNAGMLDPLAVQLDNTAPLATTGQAFNLGQSIPRWYTGSLTQLLNYVNGNTPATNAGNEVAFIRTQQATANQYATRLQLAYNGGTNAKTYPAISISEQLRLVARLIKGGLKSKVYIVNHGSFDTHSNQVDNADHTIGAHATLLKDLSDAIYTFQEDLRLMNLEDNVLGMTFSEFGRTINSNSSVGTDHGTAAPMFLFGKKVNPGVMGVNPTIPAVVNWNTNLPNLFDYKQVYMSMLQHWYCLPKVAAETVLGTSAFAAVDGATLCNLNAVALPIELLRFNVEKEGENTAHIAWATNNEDRAAFMEIERSTDGVNYDGIVKMTAKGHSHGVETYEYRDEKLNTKRHKIFYYRLRMVDNDGSEERSAAKTVQFDFAKDKLSIDVSPNPSNGHFVLVADGNLNDNIESEITVVDMFGRTIKNFTANILPRTAFNIDLENISVGIYFVTFKNGSDSIVKRVLVE